MEWRGESSVVRRGIVEIGRLRRRVCNSLVAKNADTAVNECIT